MGFNCLKDKVPLRGDSFYRKVPRSFCYSSDQLWEEELAELTLEPPSGFKPGTLPQSTLSQNFVDTS